MFYFFYVPSAQVTKIRLAVAVRQHSSHRKGPIATCGTREYLTEAEVERLLKCRGSQSLGPSGFDDAASRYRHGLRAAELVDLRWHQVDFRTATMHVRRVKQGTPSTHPMVGDELRALRRLHREQEP